MKTRFLMLCVFIAFLGLSVYAQEGLNGKKPRPDVKGDLDDKKSGSELPIKMGNGTGEADNIARSGWNPAVAFIYNKTITVDFLDLEDVMIVVTNLTTGEIICSESFVATDTAIFELNAEIGVNCKIEIITEFWSLEGEFSI